MGKIYKIVKTAKHNYEYCGKEKWVYPIGVTVSHRGYRRIIWKNGWLVFAQTKKGRRIFVVRISFQGTTFQANIPLSVAFKILSEENKESPIPKLYDRQKKKLKYNPIKIRRNGKDCLRGKKEMSSLPGDNVSGRE